MIDLYEGNGEVADEEAFLAAGYAPIPRWVNFEPALVDHGCFAWIVWRGVVQKQPWRWQSDPPVWRHGVEWIGDSVTHYIPIKEPPPP